MHVMRTMSVSAVLLLLAWGVGNRALDAQQVPSPYRFVETRQEAGFFVARIETGTGPFDLGPRSGIAYGARYGLDLSGPFGLEATVSQLSTTRNVIDPRRLADPRLGEADVSLIAIDGRVRFSLTGRRTWHSLSPFLFAGAGVVLDAASRPELDEGLTEELRFRFGTNFLAAAGGGVRWMVSERFLLRGDAHLSLWQLDTPEGFQDPELELEPASRREWTNNGTFSIGLAYRF